MIAVDDLAIGVVGVVGVVGIVDTPCRGEVETANVRDGE